MAQYIQYSATRPRPRSIWKNSSSSIWKSSATCSTTPTTPPRSRGPNVSSMSTSPVRSTTADCAECATERWTRPIVARLDVEKNFRATPSSFNC